MRIHDVPPTNHKFSRTVVFGNAVQLAVTGRAVTGKVFPYFVLSIYVPFLQILRTIGTQPPRRPCQGTAINQRPVLQLTTFGWRLTSIALPEPPADSDLLGDG
jgi:hypothetical protein